ncbi:MAG: glycosyltransferase [Actinomycetota bacterium]|nr:glycosyltransferase [Actinomycetota bacterium]
MEAVGIPIPIEDGGSRSRSLQVRRELGVDEGNFVVTTIGNLVPSKSHELFLSAAARVVAQREDVRFFVIGEGSLRAVLEEQIAREGLHDHIRLLGQRTDVDRILAATDIYVRPGIVEGLAGITVFEAQAFHVPVITFDTEDVRVAVSHMETGLLVPRGDVAALSEAIVCLVNDPRLARSLASAARRHVEQRFSIQAVADGLESLYGTLLPAGGRWQRESGLSGAAGKAPG